MMKTICGNCGEDMTSLNTCWACENSKPVKMKAGKESDKEIISLGLLREILPYPENRKVEMVIEDQGYIKYGRHTASVINTYELASRAKDWALKNNFSIHSWKNWNNEEVGSNNNCFARAFRKHSSRAFGDLTVDAKTEWEAIIKICEWIANDQQSHKSH